MVWLFHRVPSRPALKRHLGRALPAFVRVVGRGRSVIMRVRFAR